MIIYQNLVEQYVWQINLNQNDITNISDTPPTDTSVVSKKYVADNYVSRSGGSGIV